MNETQRRKEIRQGRVASRRSKLNNPREPRQGYIKLGVMKKKCLSCQKIKLASVDKCPDCGGQKFSHTFPTKTNSFVFYGDGTPSQGHKRFGQTILEIPFTFKAPPAECVMVRRENYRGGKLFCSSRLTVDERGEFKETGKAHRIGQGQLKCDPETCPFSVGGNYTDPDGTTGTIDPDRPWCTEKVTLSVWLPDLPGFDAYTIKSGSITTINNIQTAVKTLTAFMTQAGGYAPLRLKLVFKAAETSYPDPKSGGWKKSKFFTFVIQFPFAIEDLMTDAKRGQFKKEDLLYALPDGLAPVQKSLPAPDEGNYDPLVDSGPDPEIKSDKPADQKIADISQLKTDTRPQPQVSDKLTSDQLQKIKDNMGIMKKCLGPDDFKRFKKSLSDTHQVPMTRDGKLRISGINQTQADRILSWLSNQIEAQMTAEEWETDNGKK